MFYGIGNWILEKNVNFHEEILDTPVNLQGMMKDLPVKLISKQSQLESIVTSVLHASYKENPMTRFSANKENRPVCIYLCCLYNGT